MFTFCAVLSLGVLAGANFLIWRHWNGLFVSMPVPARFGQPVACLVTIAVVLFPWYRVAVVSRDYDAHMDQLRATHPFVSMEERLPAPRMSAGDNLGRVEDTENYLQADWELQDYSKDFAELHKGHVRTFSAIPGVGQMRMRSHIAKVVMPGPIPQPGTLRDEIDPTGDALPEAKTRDYADFHTESIANFVNFKTLGYFKNRREVAGFLPHAFQSLPKPKPQYALERLELVGVVRHAEPAVYVSEFLPRMTELDTVTTRPADRFEAAALAKLVAGEDLVANAVGSKVRLVGAVRNLAACVECHGGQRGDLLGAFSYRLAETK